MTFMIKSIYSDFISQNEEITLEQLQHDLLDYANHSTELPPITLNQVDNDTIYLVVDYRNQKSNSIMKKLLQFLPF